MESFRSGHAHLVSMSLECLEDVRAAKQFPSLIHEDTFVFAFDGGTLCQELIDECDWWGFADSDIIMCNFAEFVLCHWPTSFSIDSFHVFPPGFVHGKCTSKGKVCTQAMTGQCDICWIKSFLSRGSFLKFGLNAHTALVNDGV